MSNNPTWLVNQLKFVLLRVEYCRDLPFEQPPLPFIISSSWLYFRPLSFPLPFLSSVSSVFLAAPINYSLYLSTSVSFTRAPFSKFLHSQSLCINSSHDLAAALIQLRRSSNYFHIGTNRLFMLPTVSLSLQVSATVRSNTYVRYWQFHSISSETQVSVLKSKFIHDVGTLTLLITHLLEKSPMRYDQNLNVLMRAPPRNIMSLPDSSFLLQCLSSQLP